VPEAGGAAARWRALRRGAALALAAVLSVAPVARAQAPAPDDAPPPLRVALQVPAMPGGPASGTDQPASLSAEVSVPSLATPFAVEPPRRVGQQVTTQLIDTARFVARPDTTFPAQAPGRTVGLPHRWQGAEAPPDLRGWYRLVFDLPPTRGGPRPELWAVSLDRVCTNAEVWFNDVLVYRIGTLVEPLPRHCYRPYTIPLPSNLVLAQGNRLDIRVAGPALHQVGAVQRAGGLDEVRVGLLQDLQSRQGWMHALQLTVPQVACLLLLLAAAAALCAARLRREPYLGYLAVTLAGWAFMTLRTWWTYSPLSAFGTEVAIATVWTLVTVCAVLCVLRFLGRRIGWLESSLWLQCLVVPITLLLAGPDRVFGVSLNWVTLLTGEVLVVLGLFLWQAWRESRVDFWTLGPALALCGVFQVLELLTQKGVLELGNLHPLPLVIPLVLLALAVRVLQVLFQALRQAVVAREDAERQVADARAELERDFATRADLRIEQVTAKERKRIAADLHDDLGAKLLTIVHTSDNDRIAGLAREALEEMRLSVRGITGKPVNLGDAIGDWRSEAMSRLSQGGVELNWRSPEELAFTDRTIGARGYVQTTRILREAISNLLKHSGASHCEITLKVDVNDFELTIVDNGKGIPMELDGKLDRGHGMASMKSRAKQMQGQCLVESGPGYGTLIRLSLPL
jgi:signal transduction histidine kinase